MAEKKKDFRDKMVFTTYDAARICNANIASIKNWIAKGLLRAFRTPGGHFRIKRRDLELFIQKYNMPYPFEEMPKKRIYVIHTDPKVGELVKDLIGTHEFKGFDDFMEGALVVGVDRPDVVLFEYPGPKTVGRDFLKMLQSSPDTRNIQIILVAEKLPQAESMELRKEFHLEDIVEKSDGKAGILEAVSHLLPLSSRL